MLERISRAVRQATCPLPVAGLVRLSSRGGGGSRSGSSSGSTSSTQTTEICPTRGSQSSLTAPKETTHPRHTQCPLSASQLLTSITLGLSLPVMTIAEVFLFTSTVILTPCRGVPKDSSRSLFRACVDGCEVCPLPSVHFAASQPTGGCIWIYTPPHPHTHSHSDSPRSDGSRPRSAARHS